MSTKELTAPKKLSRHSSAFIENVAQLVPPGDEKPLKQALYSTASIALFLVVGCVAVSTYFVLQVFIKPLLWAVLCGSFLFPFKYALHKVLKNWLEDRLNSDQPLLLSCLFLPFVKFNEISDWLGSVVAVKWKTILAVLLGLLPIYALYKLELINIFISVLSAVIFQAWNYVSLMFQFFENHSVIVLAWVFILMITALLTTHTPMLQLVSIPMWVLILLYILSNSGVVKIPLILTFIVLAVIGLNTKSSELSSETGSSSSSIDDPGVTDLQQSSSARLAFKRSSANPSDRYFNTLFLLFLIVLVWMYAWIIFLMLIPLAFWLSKMLFFHHKSSRLLDVCCQSVFNQSKTAIFKKVELSWQRIITAFVPYPLPALISLLKKGERKVHIGILSYLPTITSILIILLLFACAIFMTVFVAVKVQQESVLAVQLASNVLNETVSMHPEYQAWLPDNETMHKTMSSIANKVYIQGREWISQRMHHHLGEGTNQSNTEKQLLRMWDNVYQTWFPKAQVSLRRLPRQTSFKTTESNVFDNLVDILTGSEVRSWLEENLASLMSVGESLLAIIQSNIGLVVSFVTSFSTAILSGGTIVLNFVVAVVIFFTTLFYLLASSTDQYKPIEVIGSTIRPLTLGTPLETAVQDAVSGVFGASIKMFGFYGLYTWTNHSMFGSNLVYIPSVLAALFGVIPLLTTYWVCIPSALEIWLLQGSIERAVCLVVFQLLPTMFVDAAIYRDISTAGGVGHPYVTGLAVAGGLYSFGLEGAITGPLILCFLLVAFNMFTLATSSSGSHTRKKQMTD